MTDEDRRKIETEREKWPAGHCVCPRREAGPHIPTTISSTDIAYVARIKCRACPKSWKRISYREEQAA